MNNLRYKLISKKYKEYFLPTLAMTMASNMAAFVDTILISIFLGSHRMSVIQICFPVLSFISFIYFMIGIGGSLLAANAQADHDAEKGNRLFTVSLICLLGMGILSALIAKALESQIIATLCNEASLIDDVAQYYSLMVLGFPLLCLLMGISFFSRADGCPNLSFYAILISNGVNLLMDCILLKTFEMGPAGAALATIIGYVCGLVYILIAYTFNKKRTFKFAFGFKKPAKDYSSDIQGICVKGFPTASIWLYNMVSAKAINNLIMKHCGAPGIEAVSVCKNLQILIFVFYIGVSQTMLPIASVYCHEEEYDKVRFILKRSIKIIIAFAIGFTAILVLFPRPVLFVYGIHDLAKEIRLSSAVRIYSMVFPWLAVSYIMTYYFQAIRKQKISALITAFENLIFPLVLNSILIPMFNMSGVWAAAILSEFIVAAVLIVLVIANGFRFFLPEKTEKVRFDFSVEMKTEDVVKKAEEVSAVTGSRISKGASSIICLAIEELLTGIVMANPGCDDTIDVTVDDDGSDIVISVRDMGVGFNPLKKDETLDYEFNNAQVLQKIAKEIEYDLSLGMNTTMIRVKKEAI